MTTRKMGRAIVFMAAALFPACAPPDPVIRASDYNQQCTMDGDCEPITEGSISCCGLDCNNNAAINRTDLTRYKEDLQDRAPSCGGVLCPAIACNLGRAFCLNSVCQGAKSCGDPLNPVPCK
jgi:hypothetical protein